MTENRFIVESVEIFECDEFDKRIVKAITDKNELYTYSDIYEISDLLNEQQATINKQERRIMVLENLLTNMSVKWVDDDD